jgi:Icc protein
MAARYAGAPCPVGEPLVNVALHTAMSLAYPLPTPGQEGVGEPGPLKVPPDELGKVLGTRQITVARWRRELALIDRPLAG